MNPSLCYQGIPLSRFMQKAFRRQDEPGSCWAACLEMCAQWLAGERVDQSNLFTQYGGWAGMSPEQFTTCAGQIELHRYGQHSPMTVTWRDLPLVEEPDPQQADLFAMTLLRSMLLLPLSADGFPGERPWTHLTVLLGVQFTGGRHDEDPPQIHSLEIADPAIGHRSIGIQHSDQLIQVAEIAGAPIPDPDSIR